MTENNGVPAPALTRDNIHLSQVIHRAPWAAK